MSSAVNACVCSTSHRQVPHHRLRARVHRRRARAPADEQPHLAEDVLRLERRELVVLAAGRALLDDDLARLDHEDARDRVALLEEDRPRRDLAALGALEERADLVAGEAREDAHLPELLCTFRTACRSYNIARRAGSVSV